MRTYKAAGMEARGNTGLYDLYRSSDGQHLGRIRRRPHATGTRSDWGVTLNLKVGTLPAGCFHRDVGSYGPTYRNRPNCPIWWFPTIRAALHILATHHHRKGNEWTTNN